MNRSKIIYSEKDTIVVKYCHPKSREYLHYKTILNIKSGLKLPIEMKIKFDGIFPYVAPMPPEEHHFKAPTIVELHVKLSKWFKKYGYIYWYINLLN